MSALRPDSWPMVVIAATSDRILRGHERVHVTGNAPARRTFYRRVPVERREMIVAEAARFADDIDTALRMERFAPVDDADRLEYLKLVHLVVDDGMVVVTPDDCVLLRCFCNLAAWAPSSTTSPSSGR